MKLGPITPRMTGRITRRRVIAAGAAVLLSGAGLWLAIGRDDTLDQLSARLDYELDFVRAGAAVPRIFARGFGPGLDGIHDLDARKDLFIRILLPIVLAENEKIADKTERVPVSLAVAQAAIESGWGTARFAVEGRATFGERTYDPEFGDMKPGESKKKFRVRAFSTLSDSVAAYLRNLNTHPEYADFRLARAAIWKDKKAPPSGVELVRYLVSYSEERHAYVEKVTRVIAENRLWAFNSARLEPAK